MTFRLVPKSVTINDFERRNGRYFALFQRIPVASGALRKSSRSLSHLLMSSCFNCRASMMGWVRSGNNCCGLGWGKKIWVELGLKK